MSWESALLDVFEDLEQQAAGLRLGERDLEVADLARSEYARVALAERCHASRGRRVSLRLVGGTRLEAELVRVGGDWLLLDDGPAQWLVPQRAVAVAAGLSPRADAQEAWSAVDRLPLRSLLRRLGESGEACVVHLLDEHRVEGLVGRVGQDFVEVLVGEAGARGVQVVAVDQVAAVRGRLG